MRRAALALAALASCAGASTLETMGLELQGAGDPDRRQALVARIMDTGDPRMVPILIDALETVIRRGKTPDPDYSTESITPLTRGPELWGLIVVTGHDFKREPAAWRSWWEQNGPMLHWDGGQRRFVR